MKTKHNFKPSPPCCINCKHSFFFDPGRMYAPIDALWHKVPYTTTVYYCNVEKECPLKTQEEFTEYGEGEWDPEDPVVKWLEFEDMDDPESSARYVGTGWGICSLYEPKEYGEGTKSCSITIKWKEFEK